MTDIRQRETCCLLRCVGCTVLLKLLDYAFEIGITGPKAACQPVSTALGDLLAVGKNLELTVLTRCKKGFNAEAIFDEGHETRDLGFVVLSGWAVNDLDLHRPIITLRRRRFPPAAPVVRGWRSWPARCESAV